MNDSNLEALFTYLDDVNKEALDFPDGAWQAYLQDHVVQFNNANKTSFDPFDSWLAWVKSRGDKPK